MISTFDPDGCRSALGDGGAADIHRSNQSVSNGAQLGLRYLVASDDHAIGGKIFVVDVLDRGRRIDVKLSFDWIVSLIASEKTRAIKFEAIKFESNLSDLKFKQRDVREPLPKRESM